MREVYDTEVSLGLDEEGKRRRQQSKHGILGDVDNLVFVRVQFTTGLILAGWLSALICSWTMAR